MIFVLGLMISSSAVFSQSDITADQRRWKLGFNAGLNHSFLFSPYELPSFAPISNDLGVRLGVLADYRVFKFLSISPKAELSFNNNELILNFNEDSKYKYEVLPISLEFMTHFIFKKNNENLSPYFYFGPNLKIPISVKSQYQHNHPVLAIDAGIGLDKALKNFNFAPELRYSYGLSAVILTPSVRSLRFHSVSLIFNFM